LTTFTIALYLQCVMCFRLVVGFHLSGAVSSMVRGKAKVIKLLMHEMPNTYSCAARLPEIVKVDVY